tara:strand:- start:528 stop:1361 length:834 start_codon:yes stop_codon:yes gene_type:complete
MAISITKPVVGGDENTWGTKLNTALDVIVDASNGTSGTIAPDLTTLTINGTDVTTTAAELNVVDGDTAATSTTVVGADRVVFNDNGTMKQVSLTDINTFIQSQAASGGTITITAGSDLTGGGNFTAGQSGNATITIDHANTSSLNGATGNSGSTFIQNLTVDDNGHLTAISSSGVPASGPSTTGSTVGTLTSPSTATVSIPAGKYFHLVHSGVNLTYIAEIMSGSFVEFGTGSIKTTGEFFAVNGGATSAVCFTASGCSFKTTSSTNSGVGATYQTL